MSSRWHALRLVLTLGIAGAVAGAVLAGVHLITRPAIERHRIEALERAAYQVLPGSTEIRPWLLADGRLLAPGDATDDTANAGQPVWEGLGPEGKRLGFAVVAEGPGFQDTIRLLYGLDLERRLITGMAVLESRETPGLGDKILDDADFHQSLRALAPEPKIEVTMGTPSAANQIDGITGATISSQAVANILDASARDALERLTAATEDPEPTP